MKFVMNHAPGTGSIARPFFTSISWEDCERPGRLQQRRLAHLQDYLLCSGSKLKHGCLTPTQSDEINQTVERLSLTALLWMKLIYPSFASLVQRTANYDPKGLATSDCGRPWWFPGEVETG